jgi:hypothetical protein
MVSQLLCTRTSSGGAWESGSLPDLGVVHRLATTWTSPLPTALTGISEV